MLYEEETGTLLCGDLFSQLGGGPALTHDDVVGPALAAERMFRPTSLAPSTEATLRSLAAAGPRTLAIVHGQSFAGDCRQALLDLAQAYRQLAAS